MRKNIEYNAKHFIQYLILSLTISFAAVFCIPTIVKQGMGADAENSTFSMIGIVAACVISFVILFLIRYDRWNSAGATKISFANVMWTVLGTSLILILGMIVISLLCGIMASLLYVLLQNVLTFDQIKGLIDFITTVIVILILPLAVSVFWKEITAKNGFTKAFAEGVSIEGRQYKKLMALLLVLFGCGLLVTTMFHFMQTNIVTNLVKMILFAVLGIVGMNFSEKIIK